MHAMGDAIIQLMRGTHTLNSQGHLPVAVQLISFLAISAKAAGRPAAGGKKEEHK